MARPPLHCFAGILTSPGISPRTHTSSRRRCTPTQVFCLSTYPIPNQRATVRTPAPLKLISHAHRPAHSVHPACAPLRQRRLRRIEDDRAHRRNRCYQPRRGLGLSKHSSWIRRFRWRRSLSRWYVTLSEFLPMRQAVVILLDRGEAHLRSRADRFSVRGSHLR
jgi:hypothetical protein